MIEQSLDSVRLRDSESVLFHELNHQFGARDHYHEVDAYGNCKWPDICSECLGAFARPASCVMNLGRMDITDPNVICDACKNEMIEHLNDHHVIN